MNMPVCVCVWVGVGAIKTSGTEKTRRERRKQKWRNKKLKKKRNVFKGARQNPTNHHYTVRRTPGYGPNPTFGSRG